MDQNRFDYTPAEFEPRIRDIWEINNINNFDPNSQAPVFSIDTPPPTVSGKLHLGHTYSYSHADFIARYKRMSGFNVFYPMGYDDNGIPTEKLVEKKLGTPLHEFDRDEFTKHCLKISEETEREYELLWKVLGLSIDWRHTYRTISPDSVKISQQSFLDLYKDQKIYRKNAPTIWCSNCQTAIAQAELEDLDRESEFIYLDFGTATGDTIPIATTRPELLAGCVAVFVNPEDTRYKKFIGEQTLVPIYGHQVAVLPDPAIEIEKGTGVMMCCTFGDSVDVELWLKYDLPLRAVIGINGQIADNIDFIAGKPIPDARREIKNLLKEQGFVIKTETTQQSIRTHDRCGKPVEYINTQQWFVRILDQKEAFLDLGNRVNWHPASMFSRYKSWVENLHWDWCISRQRYFGVPIPAWTCKSCGELVLAESDQLPVDPISTSPLISCPGCGGNEFNPDEDVMDTWATSSLTPELATMALEKMGADKDMHPMSMRSQAHEIIRNWAFYTIVKSHYHHNRLPWESALISGWGIAGVGQEKISKSKGGGPVSPLEMIRKFSADAVRYWAASTGPGKDAVIDELKIKSGAKLSRKLWSVARFSMNFLNNDRQIEYQDLTFSSADKWMLADIQETINNATNHFDNFDYAAAKNEIETFFWVFADNYLEMIKQRLYDPDNKSRDAAVFSLRYILQTTILLFAPILPYTTEYIFQAIFNKKSAPQSIHISGWPEVNQSFINALAKTNGKQLLDIAASVRRFKSDNNLSLRTEIKRLQLAVLDVNNLQFWIDAEEDIKSITRAVSYEVAHKDNNDLIQLYSNDHVTLSIEP